MSRTLKIKSSLCCVIPALTARLRAPDFLLSFAVPFVRLLLCLICLACGASARSAEVGSPVDYLGYLEPFLPPDLKNPIELAVTDYHAYALQADGIPKIISRYFYEEFVPPPSATNVIQLSAGSTHILGLRRDGTVVGWGAVPGWVRGEEVVKVPDGLTNVVAVSAGERHSLALKGDGTVVTWGPRDQWTHGVLDMPENLTNVVSIAAGNAFSIVALADGTTHAWGWTDPYWYLPEDHPPGVKQVVANKHGQYALLLHDGRVYSRQGFGGANIHYPQPAGLTNVVKLHAGGSLIGAIKNDGTFVYWGANKGGPHGEDIFDLGFGYASAYYLTRQPRLNNPTQELELLEGDDINLVANPVYDDNYQVQWRFNGAIALANGLSLSITNVKAAHAGTYTVSITNKLGFDTTAIARVKVSPSAPRVTTIPRWLTTSRGRTVTLRADVRGTEPISIEWRRADQPDVILSTNSTLIVPSAQPTGDSRFASYYVVARNALGESIGHADIEFDSGQFQPLAFDPASLTMLYHLMVEPGRPYVLQASNDLKNWTNLLDFKSSLDIFTYGESIDQRIPQRFYRLVSPEDQ
jgi:hypothetical protein